MDGAGELPGTCPGCGLKKVQWDKHDGQQVCTECGYVFPYTALVTSASNENIEWNENKIGFEGLPSLFVQRNTESHAKGKILGLVETRKIARILKLSSEKVEECCSLFEKLYYNPAIINEHIKTKLIIGGCICYTMCRLCGWPLSANEVSTLAGCSLPEFVSLFKRVQQILPPQYNVLPPDIVDLVEPLCNSAGLKELCEDVVKLIQLCKEAWLVDGRKHSVIVITAVYVAWQAQNFLERRKVSLVAFCKKHNLNYVQACRLRLKEIQQVLCELATEIPWLSIEEKVSGETVAMHLRDILKYQQSLMMEAALKVQCEHKLQDLDEDENKSDNTVTIATSDKQATGNTPTDSCFLPPAFKKARTQKETSRVCSPEIKISELDSPDLTEENTFPDSELSLYIRSSREVEMIKELDKSNI